MDYLFVDCSFVLGKPGAGRELYLRSHIPGAPHLDLEADLSATPAERQSGLQLPAADRFAEVVSRIGIGSGVFVVAYEQGTPAVAARLWWLLRHFGHDDCAILRGGLDAWRGPRSQGEEIPRPASFTPRVREDDTVDAEDLLAMLDRSDLAIVDARLPEDFHGSDSGQGHIPGARNLPYVDPSPSSDLLTAGEVIAYCGSGISACTVLHELALAGRTDAKLYPGSWSDWSARQLPAEISS